MKRTNIKETIKEYFFINPRNRLRVRQMERELKLPLPSVIRYTKELEKEGILKKTPISGIFVYSADRASPRYLLEKKSFNLKLLYDSGIISYLINELNDPAIIVFGSYAKGEDIETSDIDLFLETSSNKRISIEKYEKVLKRKIQLFIHKRLDEIKNKELVNNILNGIVLNGYIEVFK